MLSYVVLASRRHTLTVATVAEVAARCERGLVFEPTTRTTWLSPNGRVAFLGWERPGLVPVGARVHASLHGVTAFDGVPLPGAGWTPHAAWVEQLDVRLDLAHPVRAMADSLGLYSVVRLAENGAGIVVNDPLGSVPIFRAGLDDIEVLSNRPMLCELAVTTGEQRLGRDVAAVGWILATGYGSGVGTGIVGVQRLQRDEYAEIGSGGVVTARRRRSARVPAAPIAATDLPDLAREISGELEQQLRAILGLGAPLVLGLTGGRDTRLITALARSCGLDRELEYETMGAPGAADVVVASDLAERFGWRHRLVGGRRDVRPESWLRERLTQTAYATCGTLAGKHLRSPAAAADHVFVTGEFGEIFRTTEARQRPIHTMDDVDRYFAHRVLLYDRGGLVRPEVERHYARLLTERVEGLTHSAPTPGDALHLSFVDKLIMNVWGAQELLHGSQPRLYPLYSPLAYEVALGLGHDGRRHELLTACLIRHLDDELARIPLADRPFPPEAFAAFDDAGAYPTEAVRGTPGIAALKGSTVALHRPVFEELLLDRSNPVFEILDFERVASSLRSDEPIARRTERDLYNAAGAAVWLGGLEQRPA